MNKFEDIKKRGGVMVIIGSKKEVMAKIDELAREETASARREAKYRAKVEKATTIREIWDAMSDDEKEFVLAKSGYELLT